MPETLLRLRPLLPVLAALGGASLIATALVAARVVHTGRLTYAFMVYNLVLAWIPLVLALAVEAFESRPSRAGGVLAGLGAGVWLLFFPNAPYLMTDLMHLRVKNNPLFWLDLTLLQAFAWTGLALGFLSLHVVQRVVARRTGRGVSWLFAGAVLAASAFGIYLGRFRRFNSWDAVLSPLDLLVDVARIFAHPFANAQVVAYCAVLGAFLLAAYVVLQAWGAREGR
jgi:uncharacterized membrane protein